MTNQSTIERTVMRRVYIIRALRPVISMGAFSATVFVLALWGIGREVWVARVFENMPHSGDAFAVTRFYAAAFGHTDLVVQALTLAMFASVIYIARESARFISTSITQQVSL